MAYALSFSRLSLLLGAGLVCALALALNVPASSALNLDLFTGREIVATHAFPSVLGSHTFSAPQAGWFGEGWLGALGVYLLWAGGGYGALVCASALCAFAVLELVELRCRLRGLDTRCTAAAFFFVVASAWEHWRVGGGLCDLLFAAALMLCLERAPGNAVFGIIPLTILWCNASRYGFAAPLLAAFSASGRPFGHAFEQRLRRFALYATPLAAILLTPATIHAYARYVAYLELDPLASVHTWQAALVVPQAFYAGFLPMTVAASWIGLRRGAFADTLVVMGAMLLALVNGRAVGIAGVVMAPIVATALADFLEAKPPACACRKLGGPLTLLLGAMSIAALAALLSGMRGASLLDAERDQAAFVDALSSDGKAHRLFCSDPDWCSYALRQDARRIRVFMDGRYADYPDAMLRAGLSVVRTEKAWRRTLDDWKIDAVMARPGALPSLLSLLPNWKRVSASPNVWTFERIR